MPAVRLVVASPGTWELPAIVTSVVRVYCQHTNVPFVMWFSLLDTSACSPISNVVPFSRSFHDGEISFSAVAARSCRLRRRCWPFSAPCVSVYVVHIDVFSASQVSFPSIPPNATSFLAESAPLAHAKSLPSSISPGPDADNRPFVDPAQHSFGQTIRYTS
jgi:hypothetical protein